MNLVRAGLAVVHVVLPDDLQSRVHGLRPTAGQEHPVQVSGGQLGQLLRQLDRRDCGIREGVGVVNSAKLVGHRLCNLRTPVPDIHQEQPPDRVDVGGPVTVRHSNAVALDNDLRAALAQQVVVLREGHPQVVHRRLLQVAKILTGIRFAV